MACILFYFIFFLEVCNILICHLSNMNRNFGLQFLADFRRVRGEFVVGNGGDAGGIHPEFHDEGPACEGDEWLE